MEREKKRKWKNLICGAIFPYFLFFCHFEADDFFFGWLLLLGGVHIEKKEKKKNF